MIYKHPYISKLLFDTHTSVLNSLHNYGHSSTLSLQYNKKQTKDIYIGINKQDIQYSELDTSNSQYAILKMMTQYQSCKSNIQHIVIKFTLYTTNEKYMEGMGGIDGLNIKNRDNIITYKHITNRLVQIQGLEPITTTLIDTYDNMGKFDLSVDITSFLKHIRENIDQNYIIKIQIDSSQFEGDQNILLNYYSLQTNTIYKPHILYTNNGFQYVEEDEDIVKINFLNPSTQNVDNLIVYVHNLKHSYKNGYTTKLRIRCEQRFKKKEFNTQVKDIQNIVIRKLYYSVVDNFSNQPIIPFHQSTKISYNETQNYFYFSFINFPINRYYRFILKVQTDGQSFIMDNKFHTFRIE